ncbi:MAG: hypothetical protein KDE09_24175, partial [Anaerolineales bacterium]|nr:hypothetical protein [Anaerolineales bacterium]
MLLAEKNCVGLAGSKLSLPFQSKGWAKRKIPRLSAEPSAAALSEPVTDSAVGRGAVQALQRINTLRIKEIEHTCLNIIVSLLFVHELY